MQQFRPDVKAFVSRSRRRVFYELVFLGLLLLFFYLPLLDNVPESLEWIIIGSVILYILFGVAMYPSAKRTVERFSISLLDNSLSYTTGELVRLVPYEDIHISSVKKDSDSVIAVRLRTVFGQTLTIRDLKGMDDFYQKLRSHLDE